MKLTAKKPNPNAQKLLYLQVKEAVLKGEIKTSTQTAVLLASYAAVVSLGPFQERFLTEKNVFKEEMVPKRLAMSFEKINQKWFLSFLKFESILPVL